MAYRVQQELPRVVQIGQAQSLTLPIYSDADVEQTASSGTLTVVCAGVTLLDEVAVTTTGPPASYSLLAATTTGLSPSESWVETWTLTGLGIYVHTGYLVRQTYASHLTDAAMEDVHPELLHLLPPGETTAQKPRTRANAWLQRKLLNKGRRPWLVWDGWALFETELWYALGVWANDAALRTQGATEYAARARDYMDRADRLFGEVSFRYDAEQSGNIDSEAITTAAPPVLMLSGQRPGWGAWPGWGPPW